MAVTRINRRNSLRGRLPMDLKTALFACLVVGTGLLAGGVLVGGGLFSGNTQTSALTTVPTKMNFQGRLTDSTGAIKPNGTYNMRLKLYTVSSAGTPVWSEDRLVSSTQGITLQNGLFAIQLGEITSLPASLFASGALYLEIELPTPATATSATPTWTEGAMTPRNQLATSAYAYNAETLDGLDSVSFAQVSANNVFTSTNTFRNTTDSTSALNIQNAASSNLFLADTTNMVVRISNSTSTNASLNVGGKMIWTARTAAEANNWRSITYGNGLYVAVADSGTNRVMTSPDGITWTARTAAEANNWRSITYGNGLYVAVADSGTNRVMTSPDGITWTARTAAEANSWLSVIHGNGLFVAVSNTGTNRVMTSPDGITWTARTAAAANLWQSVTYGSGQYVAVSSDGTNRVMTSPDGITWTARTAAAANTWLSVTYGSGQYVAVSSDGTNRVMTSPDGITWTARTAAEANGWQSVAYGNGLYVAVSNSGTNRVMTSPDGITWTAHTATEASSWLSVTYGIGGLYVAVSYNGSNQVMTSLGLKSLSVGGDATIMGGVQVVGSFQIQNSSGANLVYGDTQVMQVTFAGNLSLTTGKTITLAGDTTANRPASPTEGMIYYDTTTKKLEVYSNGKWQADRTDAILVAASNSSQADKDAADYIADGNTVAALDGDQVQINSALTAASGKKVVLLAGTYIADATILIPNNTTFAGVGEGTIIELADIDATDNLIENSDMTTGTGVTIRDMKLDGRKDLNTVGTQNGITLNVGGGTGASARFGARVNGLSVYRFRNNGIETVPAHYSTFSENHYQDNFQGIYFRGNYSSVSDSTFNTNGVGIYAFSGAEDIIANNNLHRNTGVGIQIQTLSESTITGNFITTTPSGISMSAGNDLAITGNTISYATTYGIALSTGSRNTVSGNRIYEAGNNNTNNAIYLSSADFNNITGNTITDNNCSTTCYAINISNSTSDTNYLADNTIDTGTINDLGTSTTFANQQNGTGSIVNRGPGGYAINKTVATSSLDIQGAIKNSQLPTPAAPTLTVNGTAGSTTRGYRITALDGSGETLASTETTIATTNATLTSSNMVEISWPVVGGAIQYKIYRTTSADTPATTGLIATVSGNLLTLRDTGLAASGSVPTVNSTGGFSFTSSTGANLLGATGNGNVTVGTSDTTGTLFVLDTKTDAGDPTGLAGGMYYNSNAGKFRCYENGAWVDCVASGNSFIQNGTTAQTANFNITGNGVVGGTLTVNGTGIFNGGTQVNAGTDILLTAGSGAPTDAGDVVFRGNDLTELARIYSAGGGLLNLSGSSNVSADLQIAETYVGSVRDFHVGGSLRIDTSGNLSNIGNINATGSLVLSGATSTSKLGVSGFFNVNTTASTVSIGEPDATGTVFILDHKNTAGDPTGVNGGMYYNLNSGKFRCHEAGVWKDCISSGSTLGSSSTSVQTVSNTVTETNFTTNYTVSAGTCTPGKSYRVTVKGHYSTSATDTTLSFKLKAGATQLAGSGVLAAVRNAVNEPWEISATVVCQTTGTTGTVEAGGKLTYESNGQAAGLENVYTMLNTSAVTIDTTISQTLQISVQWGAAATGNTLTARQILFESL